MYDIDQGKAEVNENNMRKMATEITKVLSGLLDPNCNDEEPSIPQSVREIDEKMFDGLEDKIRALEAEEAARREERDVEDVEGNLKECDIPKLEALVDRFLPFNKPILVKPSNPTPPSALPSTTHRSLVMQMVQLTHPPMLWTIPSRPIKLMPSSKTLVDPLTWTMQT